MKFFKDIARIWNAIVERVLYTLDPYKVNDQVEYLRMQIEAERNEKFKIIELFGPKQPIEEEIEVAPQVPINPYIPWRVRRAQLERDHRIVKKNDPKIQADIETLEKELEIES